MICAKYEAIVINEDVINEVSVSHADNAKKIIAVPHHFYSWQK